MEVTGYPTEKNPGLLSQIIQASSNLGDLVLDCFSGSGTTLAVASQLERKWIGIDNSLEAIVTTLKRFTQGCEPMGDFVTKRDATSKDKLGNQLEELSLIDINELNEASSLKSNNNKYEVSNFALYAIESQSEKLNSILTQYLEF
ncbi:site-specific DNA-methyltransferase [Brunnivagina elsteri]|uniref:DNA methylase N-4/N-6 domain-containing protein n=1 Tax=Brunnivagina elsteri CCALA 953 TaxID=987040 RepID=A0A2A2THV2_9CYAN|nr:site-specific DNA-methyltransferase [Calothrix elsteri]PAX53208.1 hypothetical protein CK510_15165 [Calothrix elsteri CCALA 953]